MKHKHPRKPYMERSPWKYFRDKKTVLAVYIILRVLVIATMVFEFFRGRYENVFVCLLTLILFVMPSILEKRLHIDLPNVLEIIILLFIFAADILGEIQEYYVLVPHWDTWLHTINGFLFAAIGFSIVNIFNENKHVSMTLSPLYMAIAAFCFSMTIGILWEFFEWGADCLLGLDMQKDTVMTAISSVKLHPEGRNDPVALKQIQEVVVTLSDGSQHTMGIGGYLDIGLQDTMKDLLVNLIGAVVFSVIGFFYVRSKGEGRFAKHFIPQVPDNESE